MRPHLAVDLGKNSPDNIAEQEQNNERQITIAEMLMSAYHAWFYTQMRSIGFYPACWNAIPIERVVS